jgi:hypothetical protein
MTLDTILFMTLIFGICLGGFVYSLYLSSKNK